MPFFTRSNNTLEIYGSHRPLSQAASLAAPSSPHSNRELYSDTTALPRLTSSALGQNNDNRRASVFGFRSVARLTGASQRALAASGLSRAPSAASSRASVKEGYSPFRRDPDNPATNFAKNILARGKRLRRSDSRSSLTSSIMTMDDAAGNISRPPVCPHHRPDAHCDCKYIAGQGWHAISYPFDFQHVTHSHSEHFRNLDRTDESDLVAEFSAVRAAQQSRPGLRGIKAQELQRRETPAQVAPAVAAVAVTTQVATAAPATEHMSMAVPFLPPDSSDESLPQLQPSSRSTRTHSRSVRSQESFSQPFHGSRRSRPADTALRSAPPRSSSIGALPADQHPLDSRRLRTPGEHQRVPSDPPPYEESQSSYDDRVTHNTVSSQPPQANNGPQTLIPASRGRRVDQQRPQSTADFRSSADFAADEDTQSNSRLSTATTRTESWSSVCTVVLSPPAPKEIQSSTVTSIVAPSKIVSHQGPRYGHVKRSSTTNGLFSSWDLDSDMSDHDALDSDGDMTMVEAPVKKRNKVGFVTGVHQVQPKLHKPPHSPGRGATRPSALKSSKSLGKPPATLPPLPTDASAYPSLGAARPVIPQTATPQTSPPSTPTSPASHKRSQIPVMRDSKMRFTAPHHPRSASTTKADRILGLTVNGSLTERPLTANDINGSRQINAANAMDQMRSPRRHTERPRSRLSLAPATPPPSVPVPAIPSQGSHQRSYSLFPLSP